ncbi:uncharacterized protein B0H18DRAFT_958773 [Fomitopsis serialis]|uniref:uncharacterized protein n=1 Tax=Fomitopsis serialis TaxID=139415 RepID=UPI0020089893|nr:uncharacterized protein B0H18DRAFT_958773 [Neoantrodia serialis]KAH9916646.1 hypothetical protein B0H18DRAFT_958773 [Neoantrodia serialis]
MFASHIASTIWYIKMPSHMFVFVGFRIMAICLSRLLLNLREVALGPQVMSSSISDMSDIEFSRILGPLGNSLGDESPDVWGAAVDEVADTVASEDDQSYSA